MIAIVVVQWAHYARIMRSRACRSAAMSRNTSRPRRTWAFRPGASCCATCCQTAGPGDGVCHHPDRQRHRAGSHARSRACPSLNPSLGLLIANGFRYLLSGDYWISMFPGLALLLLILAINVIADRLRAALDPRSP